LSVDDSIICGSSWKREHAVQNGLADPGELTRNVAGASEHIRLMEVRIAKQTDAINLLEKSGQDTSDAVRRLALLRQALEANATTAWKPRHRSMLIQTSAYLSLLWVSLVASSAHAETMAGRAAVIGRDTPEIYGERIRILDVDAPESRRTCEDQHGAA
jgi:hypothetical protein